MFPLATSLLGHGPKAKLTKSGSPRPQKFAVIAGRPHNVSATGAAPC